VDWDVVFLREADEDLDSLAKAGAGRKGLEAGILDQFRGFKGDRIQKLLESGTTTKAVDRLDGSAYPTSIRLHVLQDYRATAWLFPAQRHAFVVHVFAKSRDPDYKQALATHDGRLMAYFESLAQFHSKRKRRR
jgi:hypothetical protein